MDSKNIRNFAIIAHVDHGKSTLADRLLEMTATVAKNKMQEQFLDQNPISRERGITIKLAPVRMNYIVNNTSYILNLIDTPGHVDFSYEVSRTLACCEGVVLLVDASQGIQAQTVAHLQTARKLNLVIIPVLNKVDLPNSQVESVKKSLVDVFGFKEEEILSISAKTGQNVETLLHAIIERIPFPKPPTNEYLRALIFDAVYDIHRGVVAFVRVFDGKLDKEDHIGFFQNNTTVPVTEVGYFSPFLTPAKTLHAGEIGYIVTGIKDIRQCNVGDTITTVDVKMKHPDAIPLPGYKKPLPMVFFGVYPKNTNELVHLKEGLAKVALTDASLTFAKEYSAFLGSGYRVGFLGLLHAEIIKERIKQEAGIAPLLTMPQVLYEREGEEIREPYMRLTVYTPTNSVGGIITICQKKKGELVNMTYHDTYAVLEYDMPYSMVIRGLSSDIKSASLGFASIDYEATGYRKADLVPLEVRINDVPIDVLSELVYRDEAIYVAREKIKKLKETLPRQQFRQILQGVVGGQIIAREDISPFRKDVLQKMSGGDRTRKDKLLDKQKKGKSKMLINARVELPQEALLSMIESS